MNDHLEKFVKKLNLLKKEVDEIRYRNPFNQMVDRLANIVNNFIGESNKYSERINNLKVIYNYSSLMENEQESFKILIDSIIDEFESDEQQQVKIKESKKQNKIELTTRRNIIDGFLITKIPWYGKLEQGVFLGRLFDLSKLPSNDSRYKTADQDIYKHTVLNNDWPDEWVFSDSRFNILHLNDEQFLEFLCLTIHPTIREKDDQITTLLEIYNNNLSKHGIEITKAGEIAGRPLFEAKIIGVKTSNIKKAKTEKRLALIIGCSNYEFAGLLNNPINDANAVEITLRDLGFETIKILNPSQKNLKLYIDEFGDKLRDYTAGLFYFAGHGIQVKGLNYLIPVDANLKSEKMVEYDCVEAERILRHMEDNKSEVNILILDACRDNPFERSWSRGISQRGLATMTAPKGSLIAYSTSPGKTANDGDGQNGLYTEILLNHISKKNISIITMFQNVRIDVITKSKNEQIPWESTSLTSDFYFNS